MQQRDSRCSLFPSFTFMPKSTFTFTRPSECGCEHPDPIDCRYSPTFIVMCRTIATRYCSRGSPRGTRPRCISSSTPPLTCSTSFTSPLSKFPQLLNRPHSRPSARGLHTSQLDVSSITRKPDDYIDPATTHIYTSTHPSTPETHQNAD